MDTTIDAQSRAELVASLKAECEKVRKERGTCNIFLCGPSGAGKSSLVNAVFGENWAKTGVGAPVTKGASTVPYMKNGNAVAIYDVEGIEHRGDADYKQFLENQVQFFVDINRDLDFRKHIHLIWFVANAQTHRVEGHIATVCDAFVKAARELCERHVAGAQASEVPVLLVWNKAEGLTKADRSSLLKACESLPIPQDRIFTVSADRQAAFSSLKFCPACDSHITTDYEEPWLFRCKAKTCEYCMDGSSYFSKGYMELVEASTRLLPDAQQRAFVVAQQVAVDAKQEVALRIIREYADVPTAMLSMIFGSTKDSDMERQEMIAKLCDVWQMEGEANETTSMAVSVMVLNYIPTLIDKILPINFFSSRAPDVVNKSFLLPFVGLTVNNSLRNAYIAALADVLGGADASVQVKALPTEDSVYNQMQDIWEQYRHMQSMDAYIGSLGSPDGLASVAQNVSQLRRRRGAGGWNTEGSGEAEAVLDDPQPALSSRSPPPPSGPLPPRSPCEAAIGATVLAIMLAGIWIVSHGWFPKVVATVMCTISIKFIIWPYSWEEEEGDAPPAEKRNVAGVETAVDTIMSNLQLHKLPGGQGVDEFLRRPLKAYMKAEISGMTQNVAESLEASCVATMRRDYYPESLIKILAPIVRRFFTDARAGLLDAGLDVSVAPRSTPYIGPLRAARRVVLYRLFPYDKPFWKKIEDPLWWTFSCIATFPIWGVRELCWFVIYFWIDKSDPYQVVSAIVGFKGLHFLTLGMLQLSAGAAKYFLCSNTVEPYCAHKGPGLEWYEVFGFIAQLVVMMHALRVLAKLPASVGMQKAQTTHRDSILYRLLKYDLLLAVVVFLVCCGSLFVGDRAVFGMQVVGWQVKAIFYWGRVIYAAFSFPFLIFKIPAVLHLLTHARRTGYDVNGNLQFSS